MDSTQTVAPISVSPEDASVMYPLTVWRDCACASKADHPNTRVKIHAALM